MRSCFHCNLKADFVSICRAWVHPLQPDQQSFTNYLQKIKSIRFIMQFNQLTFSADLLWMAGSEGICVTWSPVTATCDGDGDRQRQRRRQSQLQVHLESSGARRGYQGGGSWGRGRGPGHTHTGHPGARPRIRKLGEAEGRGERGSLINSIETDIGAPLADNQFGNVIQLQKQIRNAICIVYTRFIPGIYLND